MARTPRPAYERRRSRWYARTGAIVAVAVVLMTALPTIAIVAPEVALPSPVVRAADSEVRLDRPSAPVRIQIPYAGIDLPVVSSERRVSGNTSGYPLCDVAQYWTRYDLPGAPGTTWIYAHAQPGMFLPLFTISEASAGTGLIGKIVEIQTRDRRLLRYRISEVKERATGLGIARQANPRQHRLILQTSTGPPGTIPKLQLAARLVGAEKATEPAPKAMPRACWQPRPQATPKKGGSGQSGGPAQATAVPVEITATEPIDTTALLAGSGAILLGATLVAVYLVRRGP